jgi:predicted O-methyltransferase YrrM
MASGLEENSQITSLEYDEELSFFHEKYISNNPKAQKIKVIYGDANHFLEQNKERYDFVFMDAGKKDYVHQYELLVPMMECGDTIIADNVLWKSLVLNEEKDRMTSFMHEFNEHVFNDIRVDNVIIPLRDGVHLITKK